MAQDAKEKKTQKRDNSTRKQIRFGELLSMIEKVKGDDDLAAWVKRACNEKLIRDHSDDNGEVKSYIRKITYGLAGNEQ